MDKYLEIKRLFEAKEDKENAVAMSKYMRDQFAFYGIPSPVRKEVYHAFLKQEKKNKQVDWAFLDQCYKDEHREFQYLVSDYLNAMSKFLIYEDVPKIKSYIQVKQWWDTIDFLDKVIGSIGLRDDRINALMVEWSKADDIWLRRIAIDHQLGRKEKTNQALLEEILLNNLGKDEFFINKAIGWSLRDYSKINSQWVRDFIAQHSAQLDRLSIKEASKYIEAN